MRKTSISLMALAVITSAMLAPAQAAKKQGPVATTLYLHGESPSGEVDSAPGLIDLTSFMKMDPTAPTGTEPRSKGYVWSNTQCGGNRLHPVWVGKLSGKIVGDIKLTFTSASAPQSIDVRVWPDLFAQACNAEYRAPAADETFDVPAGRGLVEVTIPTKGFAVSSGLMVQLSPTPVGTDTPGFGRVFYDSVDTKSRLEFNCVPRKGGSCT